MKLKIRKKCDHAIIPKYELSGDAGLDLLAAESVTLKRGEISFVATGIGIEIPEGYVGLIWDKSSLASKGLKVVGGVIDSGYRGEVKVGLTCVGTSIYKIEEGDKVAQILVQKVERMELEEVTTLSESERGNRGFGSTGK